MDTENIVAEKRAKRRAMRARRRDVSATGRAAVSRSVCAQLLADARLRGTVAVYLATDEEIDLSDFIAATSARLVAPRWNAAARDYELAELTAAGTAPGHWGIREPVGGRVVPPGEVTAWVVPGLAFTRDGSRLGYGGGFYDRLLAAAAPSALLLGVAYPFQLVGILPAEPHDIRLTGLVVGSF